MPASVVVQKGVVARLLGCAEESKDPSTPVRGVLFAPPGSRSVVGVYVPTAGPAGVRPWNDVLPEHLEPAGFVSCGGDAMEGPGSCVAALSPLLDAVGVDAAAMENAVYLAVPREAAGAADAKASVRSGGEWSGLDGAVEELDHGCVAGAESLVRVRVRASDLDSALGQAWADSVAAGAQCGKANVPASLNLAFPGGAVAGGATPSALGKPASRFLSGGGGGDGGAGGKKSAAGKKGGAASSAAQSASSSAHVPRTALPASVELRVVVGAKFSGTDPAPEAISVVRGTDSGAAEGSGADAALDAVVAVVRGDTAGDLLARVLRALASQRRSVAALSSSPSLSGTALWRVVHFAPTGFAHHVSVAYPDGVEDGDASVCALRAAYHGQVAVPRSRPALRGVHGSRAMTAVSLETRKGWTRHLRNVHEGLPPSGVKDGQLHLVHGEYEYYHYMQDSFDDDGWGCAYRSLQTIFSWFRLQQFTDRVVPGHREIQETLVKVKDKESKFIGSRQWIGAFECSLCLDSLLGVTSKILNVTSGAELAEKGRELARHFDTQGSPIMVGGGVLAYTLLGIDFNALTGDIRFLILDPHYVGNDDMKVIHKSWCKWHDVSIFRADAFYNLCCPQAPEGH